MLVLGVVLVGAAILVVAVQMDDDGETPRTAESPEPVGAIDAADRSDTADPARPTEMPDAAGAGDNAATSATADTDRAAVFADPAGFDRCESQAILAAHGLAVLADASDTHDNPVFSPEGLRSVFEILDWGASDEARRRIAAYFFANAEPSGSAAAAFRFADCAWRHPTGTQEPVIEAQSADHVFLRGGTEPLPAVVQLLADRERVTEFHTIPDNDFAAWLRSVNRAIADSTDGLIEDALSLRPSTEFALSNVMAFDAPWLFPFDPANTRSGPFTMADGTTTMVAMMESDIRDVLVVEGDTVLRVLLLYADGDHYMHLVLPSDRPDSRGPAAGLPAAALGVRTTTSEFQDAPVIDWPGSAVRAVLWLPRFDVAGEVDLSDHMKATGHGDVLTDGGAFVGLTGQTLLLDQITQKVRVRTDEEGSAAAAVTTAVMSRAAVVEEFREIRFDRPFLYVIGQASTGALLAMGIVGRPEPMDEPG